MQKVKTNRNAFTIVELVIVIAVIAILAAVLIPTFVSLIRKANESVDMQMVKGMNTVLEADEILNGTPSTVVDAKKILEDNGYDDFTPVDSANVFYWSGSDNRVLLWNKTSDTEGEVTYPRELKKKYKKYTTPSADWHDLSIDIDDDNAVINVESVGSGKTPYLVGLQQAIKKALNGSVIRLPENQTIAMGQGWNLIGTAMANNEKENRAFTIDLNGSTLNCGTSSYRALEIPANYTLEIVNGSILLPMKKDQDNPAFIPHGGASLILRNVDMTTSCQAAVYPYEDASEIIIDNCTIKVTEKDDGKGGAYGIATNKLYTSNIRISITNSYISARSALFVNTSSSSYISNSTLEGVDHAVLCRIGTVTIENSTLKNISDGDGDYTNYNSSNSGLWGTGKEMPCGVVVIGDYYKDNTYSGDAVVKMVGVTIESKKSSAYPDVILAAKQQGKIAKIDYSECTIDENKILVYGDSYSAAAVTFEHQGTITVNGKKATLVNGKTKIEGKD